MLIIKGHYNLAALKVHLNGGLNRSLGTNEQKMQLTLCKNIIKVWITSELYYLSIISSSFEIEIATDNLIFLLVYYNILIIRERGQ